ncbi:hypothetical protein K7X08_005134 [Anisodus acutangulus]|uniref:Uncharacterized protein n=1 Tax=Anisodus acutangulus TaxID=402998 RepID=A0A9Q1MF43_9SOLA|nr:hypothetical protein K7X08_005134 [Anisodus acutangulus]
MKKTTSSLLKSKTETNPKFRPAGEEHETYSRTHYLSLLRSTPLPDLQHSGVSVNGICFVECYWMLLILDGVYLSNLLFEEGRSTYMTR